jgi:2-oxoglutarate dehydrogenase complex dehydrogenase (E1) component-like enzyme
MGAWTFIQSRFRESVPGNRRLTVAARHESASPAAGSQHMHEYEHKKLLERALR